MPSPKLKRYSLSWGPRTPLKRGLSPRRAVGTPKWRARSRCASPLSLENLRVREQDVLQNSRASGPLRWRAGTHRYDPLGLGHLPVEPGHPLCHLPREGAGDDHDVSCRGEAVKEPAPKRSLWAMPVDIISMAPHASPNCKGHKEFFRAQLNSLSVLVVIMSGSLNCCITPI